MSLAFNEQAVASLKSLPAAPWLHNIRASGAQVFRDTPWPSRKTENWKYTSLFALEQQAYHAPAPQVNLLDDSRFAITGLNAQRLVFVNGHFNAALSDKIEGLVCVPFSQANATQQALIAEKLNGTFKQEQHLFGALNNAALQEGVLIHLAKNQVCAQPVQIVHVQSADEGFSSYARHLIVLEQHSEATVLEHFVSAGNTANNIHNQLTEVFVGEGAKLNHYRLHLENGSQSHFGGVHVNLAANSVFNSFQLALGGKIKRIDVVVNHLGSGAHSDINGVYLPKEKQHIDFHTCIEHAVPHCTSNEVFRGIIADQAKAVFNGRIHIHKHAQKTAAELSNKNLLLSNQAEINTKPELEIYADDVRCAHGATIAQLDEKARFYLQSRGISRQEAEVMLSFGFINELIDGIALEPVAQLLRPILAKQFISDERLARHLI